MNETICSIISAIEEGRSWGHDDAEIANYLYSKYIQPLEARLGDAPDLQAAFLEGFMLTREGRNGQAPFAGDYREAWKAVRTHVAVSSLALDVVREDKEKG